MTSSSISLPLALKRDVNSSNAFVSLPKRIAFLSPKSSIALAIFIPSKTLFPPTVFVTFLLSFSKLDK